MSVRSDKTKETPDAAMFISEASDTDASLGEGGNFCVASPENPLSRQVVVSIRASLNELCLSSQKGVWSPTPEALKAVFQQKKFTTLDGSAEAQGDLKSVVLHNLSVSQASSSFPVSLGTKITGVDDNTFSSIGAAFSTIVLPNSTHNNSRTLQKDDVSLAYEFAKKFPGYTSENLSVKGIHEVSQRRFVLVSADHPIVSAISENADKLQMGEISMMPEGLIKVSQGLYDSILPLVKTQVESQIKVRDFSRAQVSIQPAEYASWSDARAELMVEAKRPLKAQLAHELSKAADEAAADEVKAEFERRQHQLEHEIDHRPLEFHMSLDCQYNFLSR